MASSECDQNLTVEEPGKDRPGVDMNQEDTTENGHSDIQSQHEQEYGASSQQQTDESSTTAEHGQCDGGGDGDTVLTDRMENLAVGEGDEDSEDSYHSLTNQEAEELLREVEDDARDAFKREKQEDTSTEKEELEKPEEEGLSYDFPTDGEGDACAADDEEEEEKEHEKARLKDEEALSAEVKEERKKSSQKLKDEGNQLFRQALYEEAITLYTQALEMCPLMYKKERAIMFSNRAACKMKQEKYESAIKDCTKAIDLHPEYLKAIGRRAELYERAEKLDEAMKDHQRVLELDPGQHASRAACLRLDEAIKERNEKLKNEMLGKLKDLGNMVLRPFGLSTNNFKLQQDPNSGGYSVQFVQNPPTNGN